MTNLTKRAFTLGGILMIAMPLAGFSMALESGPVINAPAPGWSGVTSTGETLSLDQFSGKTVIMEWTNDGCPFVKKHYNSGNMQATQEVASADDNVVWISVISSAPGKQGHVSPAQADELTTSRGAKPDYVILDEEGTIGRSYDARTTPQIFVINADGVLKYDGAMDDNPSANLSAIEGATNYALGAMNAVLSGQDPDPAKTKPYGCSVKYKS